MLASEATVRSRRRLGVVLAATATTLNNPDKKPHSVSGSGSACIGTKIFRIRMASRTPSETALAWALGRARRGRAAVHEFGATIRHKCNGDHVRRSTGRV
jgi:hypothetical protein